MAHYRANHNEKRNTKIVNEKHQETSEKSNVLEIHDSHSENLQMENTTEDYESNEFKCDFCDKIFNNNYQLIRHQEIVHSKKESKVFTCDLCDKNFKFMNYLKSHQFEVHEKKHKCNLCEKKFCKPYQVELHFDKVHLEKREYECDICEKTFDCASDLKSHMATLTQNNLPTLLYLPWEKY